MIKVTEDEIDETEDWLHFVRRANRTHSVRAWLNRDGSITLMTHFGGFFGHETLHAYTDIAEAMRMTKDYATLAPAVVNAIADYIDKHDFNFP